MKKILLAGSYLLIALQALTQSSFSPVVKKFIDYDTAVIAFTHCKLADVKHLKVLEDQTVIVRNGIIAAVGDSKNLSAPPGSTVIDLTGKSLLPGFVLLHEHMYYAAYSADFTYLHVKQLPYTFPKLYLACGATTIRTAGSVEPYSDLNLKRDIDAGKILGPAMDVTAPYLEGKGSIFPGMHQLSGPEEAKAFVDFWAGQGCTSFKGYMFINRPTLKAAIDEAHAKGLKVTGHLCAVTYHEAAEMGIDQLEHGFSVSTDFVPDKKENACPLFAAPIASADSPGVKALIRFLIDKKVTVTSTLAVIYNMTTLDTSIRPEVLEAMSPDTRDMFLNVYNKMRSPFSNKAMGEEFKMEKMFSDAGGLLTVGTDPTGSGATLAGYGSQQSIELLTQAGFRPIEAIRIATYNGAKALGLEDKIGSIEVGKSADLVVIDGDISENIQNIRKIEWVFKKGVGFNSQKIFSSVKGEVGKY
ncbi:MAG TPA: amidohydrolase family protein [Puia sp.]|nr:amidohydrolase family protein [Puia sp.]